VSCTGSGTCVACGYELERSTDKQLARWGRVPPGEGFTRAVFGAGTWVKEAGPFDGEGSVGTSPL